MATLTAEQLADFDRDGYLLLEDAIPADKLEGLRTDFKQWVEECRKHTENYGETSDGRPRFSVQAGHNADSPALRRISSPNELSEKYLNAMRDSRAL